MILELKIDRYGANGEGIALYNNKVVFVPFALKGEIVKVEILKEYKTYYNAKLLNVIKKSEKRTQPLCPYYKICGGCNLQHANYKEQLKIKETIVKNNLEKYAHCNFNLNPIIESNLIYNYRNHISFHVNKKGELGFYKNSSNDFIKILNCHLANNVINLCISIFNNYFFKNHIKGYDKKTKQGLIKLVDFKIVNNKMLITIVSTNLILSNINQLVNNLKLIGVEFGLFISLNNYNNTLIYGQVNKNIFGLKEICYNEKDIISYIGNYSFLQINDYIKDLIYDKIINKVTANCVVDLYAGRAIVSALLSKKIKKVYAVEIVKEACFDANKMLADNNIKNVTILCEDANLALLKINEKVDCVIVDPPRKGMERKTILSILQKKPKQIVYLSCSSNTLARDLNIFLQDGNYKLTLVQPYDMFPNTANIETLAFMEKI